MNVLCYELNEVPWKVVDYYVEMRPHSNLAALLSTSHSFTTRTKDEGELHPWSTWPTMHRGVSNQLHGIKYLNQDLSSAEAWPPIWDILAENGVSTGVFGSLQSFPAKSSDANKFYIPDTFAPQSFTHPSKYEGFQRFNLAQTGENKAVSSQVSTRDLQQVLALLKSGIKLSTLAKVFVHLVNEIRIPWYKSRRATLQPLLAFDVFMDCLKDNKPEFVSFYSNHVAGIMHRFWRYTFPEDFGEEPSSLEKAKFHSQSILKAMDIFDEQIGVLLQFASKHNYSLIVASSMGQEAIERGDYLKELGLHNFQLLEAAIGFEGKVTLNLAMQPDVAFEFKDEVTLKNFSGALDTITDSDGNKLIPEGYASVGLTLNRKLVSTARLVEDEKVLVDGRTFHLVDLGLTLFERDQGTGYHQPDGILIWQSDQTELDDTRRVVDSRQFLPTVLSRFNIASSSYMQPAIQFCSNTTLPVNEEPDSTKSSYSAASEEVSQGARLANV